MPKNDLLARAAALIERNKVLQSVPGSGYHDTDVDFHGKLVAPHMRHLPGGQEPGAQSLPPISDHVIAFFGERSVVFVGPCAERVLAALRAYRDKYSAMLMDFVEGRSGYQLKGTEYKLVREIPKLIIKDGELTLWLDTWNDFLHALYEQDIGITGAPYATE